MNYSFKDMTLTELHEMRNSLTEAIFQKELKEENKQDLALNKVLRDFVKKHKKVKIEANIPVVIEYDLSEMNDYYTDYGIKDLESMFDVCDIFGNAKVNKGLKPKMKTLINDYLEGMQLCPEAIKLFKPDLWKQMVTDFEEFLKLKS
jgi:MoaA/NifB/PqqE/SkfB family radical SAM enzyme